MTLFENEVGVDLQWTILDKGKVVNLSALTITAIQLFINGLTVSPLPLTVLDAPNGIVHYITQAGDFPAGQYSYNIVLALANPVRDFTTKTKQLISKPLYGN